MERNCSGSFQSSFTQESELTIALCTERIIIHLLGALVNVMKDDMLVILDAFTVCSNVRSTQGLKMGLILCLIDKANLII